MPMPGSLGGGDGDEDGGDGEEEEALDGGLLVARGCAPCAPRGRRPPWLRWVPWPGRAPVPCGRASCREPAMEPRTDSSSSPPESQRYTFLTLRVVPKPSWCERSVPKLSRGIRCWA